MAYVWVRVFSVDTVPPGEMVGVEVGEHRLAIYNVDGRFHATQNVCPHQFAILSDGWLDGGIVECPLHGGRFEVATGRVLCEPAEDDLRTYDVRIEDGHVEVLMPENS